MFFIIFMFLCSMISFLNKWNHILLMLINLDLVFLVWLIFSFQVLLVKQIILFLLIMGVMESVFGLLLIVILVRFYGNDKTNNFLW